MLNILIAVVSDSYEYAVICARKLFMIARLDLVAELDMMGMTDGVRSWSALVKACASNLKFDETFVTSTGENKNFRMAVKDWANQSPSYQRLPDSESNETPSGADSWYRALLTHAHLTVLSLACYQMKVDEPDQGQPIQDSALSPDQSGDGHNRFSRRGCNRRSRASS